MELKGMDPANMARNFSSAMVEKDDLIKLLAERCAFRTAERDNNAYARDQIAAALEASNKKVGALEAELEGRKSDGGTT